MEQFDFASMNVGDERKLAAGPWEDHRPIYEQCMEYVKTVTPHPQFEFQEVKDDRPGHLSSWLIRRIR